MPTTRPERSWLLPLLVGGSLLLAIAVYALIRAHNARDAEAQLAIAADRQAQAVQQAFWRFQYGLRGLRGAILASGGDAVRYPALKAYADSRDLAVEFPGARGFGFIRRVPREQLAAYQLDQRRERPGFTVHQLLAHGFESMVIEVLEPLAGNQEAIGLDIASETHRREAALAALRRGEPTLSAPITLVQFTGLPRRGLLLLMPIQRSGWPVASEAERAAATLGFSYAPLLVDDILGGLGLDQAFLQLTLRDLTEDRSAPPFYQGAGGAQRLPGLWQQRRLDLYGRHWQLEIAALPGYVQTLRQPPALGLALGTLAAGLLLALMLRLRQQGQAREQLLQAQRLRLATLVSGSDAAIIGKDRSGRITSWNRAAERLFGYPASAAEGRLIQDLILPAERHQEEAELLDRAFAGETLERVNTQRRHRDGSTVDIELTLVPIRDGQGEVDSVAGIARDITAPRRAESVFAELLALTRNTVGEPFLLQAAEALSRVMGAELVLIARASDRPVTRVEVLAAWEHGAARPPWSFDLAGTPCALVYQADPLPPDQGRRMEEVTLVSRDLQRCFSAAAGGPFHSFLGFPLHDDHGELTGHVAALFTEPLSQTRGEQLVAAGRLFAQRVEAELKRLAVERQRDDMVGELHKLNSRLELTVAERTREMRRLYALQQEILSQAGFAIIATDPQGLISVFNPAAERLLGYPAAEMVGRATPAVFHLDAEVVAQAARLSETLGEPVAAGFEAFVALARRGQTDTREWTYRRRDGREVPVLLSVSALRGEDGTLEGFLGMAVDLSERRRLESELKLAQVSIDASPDAMYWMNPSGRIVRVNQAACDMLGYSREELTQRSVPDIAPTFPPSAWQAHWEGFRHQSQQRLESQHRHKNGHDIDIAVSSNYVRDGEREYVYAVVKDIGEIKAAQRLAEAASAAKSSFLANLSHEIRTPLNAILGLSRLLEQSGLNLRQHDYVQTLDSAARTLLALLNDILDFSKIEAGKLSLESGPFSLQALLDEILPLLQQTAASKPVELVVDLDPRLGDRLVGDALRLKQVLLNLLGNALKFTERGSVVLEIRTAETAGSVQVQVRDTGIGIPEAQQAQLFAGFHQAEASTARRFGGTGLGLAISQRIVGLMGGRIEVRSASGAGSCFYFSLPLQAEPAVLTASGTGRRLWLAEPEASADAVLRRQAQARGWQVAAERSPAAILEQVQSGDRVLLAWPQPGCETATALNTLAETLYAAGAELKVMLTVTAREALLAFSPSRHPPGLLLKPLLPERAVGDSPPTVALPVSPAQRRLLGLRLLVVEDHPVNQQVALELLQDEGATVTVVASGAEALALLRPGPTPPAFDLVLMDLHMPGMDGLATTRALRGQLGCTLPIIAMTADTRADQREACLAAGMNDHIGKPFNLDGLCRAILAQLSGAGELDPEDVHRRLEQLMPLLLSGSGEALERIGQWRERVGSACPDPLRALHGAIHQLDYPLALRLSQEWLQRLRLPLLQGEAA
ncbi:MAG TPA: PAS domain S-box protein [Nevskiaceae bacterium]|nr:PAS domain S-box protein [Nevskiaceae bacterium]